MLPDQSTPGWTPCTRACAHHGPFRVHLLDNPDGESFLVGPQGAPAGYAFVAPPGRIYVEAPTHAASDEFQLPEEDGNA